MSDWTERLYFILSSPRSGSSMLRNKLSEFSQILTLPNDMRIIEFFNLNKDLLGRDQSLFMLNFREQYEKNHLKMFGFDEWSEFSSITINSLDQFLWNVFLFYAKSIDFQINNATVFVEKSPNNVLYLDHIRHHLPYSHFIHLYRDARDVVASLNCKFWSGHNTYTNSLRWSREQRLLLEACEFSIGYEALVERPVESMQQITGFMKYTNEDEVLKLREKDVKMDQSIKVQTFKAIHTGNRGKYMHILSTVDRELEIIESICKLELMRLGYALHAKNHDMTYFRKRFFLALEHWTVEIGGNLKRLFG